MKKHKPLKIETRRRLDDLTDLLSTVTTNMVEDKLLMVDVYSILRTLGLELWTS